MARSKSSLTPRRGGSADSDVVIANAPSGAQGRNVPFQIRVPTEWGLQAGTFTDELQLALIDQGGNIVDTSTLTVTILIPSAVSLRLVGAVVGGGGGGPAQVDLGRSEEHTYELQSLMRNSY